MLLRTGVGHPSSCCVCHMQDEKLGSLLSGSLSQNYDAVIGSLPRGMSADERMRIKNSMPMSPAMNALQKIPEVCLCVCVLFGSMAAWLVCGRHTSACVVVGVSMANCNQQQ